MWKGKDGPNRQAGKILIEEYLLVEQTLSEEIVLNKVSLEGSPTINFAL